MQNISREEVEKLAELSRMKLQESEVSRASVDLSAALQHFENIQNVDTQGVPPADDVTGLKNVMREDIARDGILGSPEELLQNARTQNGYVVVSGVFADNGVS